MRANCSLIMLAAASMWAAMEMAARAEDVLIESFDLPGEITFSKLENAAGYRVEWASAAGGTWTSFTAAAASLDTIISPGLGTVTAAVPMLYRVVATVTSAPPPSGMVLVQGGTFIMQAVDGSGIPTGNARTTTVSSFCIGKYEVTWEEWQTVRSWAATNGYDIGSVGAGCATNHPSHSMTWYNMVKWCNARSQKEGRTPCYTVGGSVYKTGQSAPDCNWSAAGYRLPTEAEWEFAASGGNQSHGYEYSGSADVGAVAWYDANSSGASCDYSVGGGTWPVGGKQANELGLYDMSGNVWEWCWDWYAAYGSGPVTDPRGPATGSPRVGRGGFWSTDAFCCRVAFRSGYTPFLAFFNIGFRVVLPAGQ